MRILGRNNKKGKKVLITVPDIDLPVFYTEGLNAQSPSKASVATAIAVAVAAGSGGGEGSSVTGSSSPVVSDLIYNSLSAAGKTTFDATTVGNFFSVSAADYASVFANVTGATKYAMTDSQLAESVDAWSGGYAFTLDASTSTIPISSYVIGFAARADSAAAGTITPLVSTTYKGTYTAISNSPTFAAGSPSAIQYYIRRNPSTPVAATSYLALVATTNRRRGSTTYGGSYALTPYSSWTNYAGAPGPVQQFIATTTKSWS